MKPLLSFLLFVLFTATLSCQLNSEKVANTYPTDSLLQYADYKSAESDTEISRSEYADKLYGFWLGQCIANWTGLVTEMDKIG
ncbi:MAG: hypothetical protein ACJATY_003229, partial [Spirosomataceae bacterium]